MLFLKAASLLERLGIAHTPLAENQINDHKQAWVNHFIPPEKHSKAIECYCLPTDDGCSDYLWHAFSFELLDGLCGNEAHIALQCVQIGEAVLLSNWEDAGFYIPDASALTASTLEGITDFVLTSADFKWTYAKTHELELGPYFFKVQ